MDLTKLIEERNKLWHQAKAILDGAEAEKRTLNGEEKARYDALCADIDKFGEQIDTEQRKQRAAEIQQRMTAPAERRTAPASAPAGHPTASRPGEALRAWLARSARLPLSADQVENARACGFDLGEKSVSLRIGRRADGEQRAMSVGTGTAGGTFANWDMGQGFDRALLAYGNALQLVRRINTSQGIALPIPTVDDTANSATIVAEAGAIPITPDPTTGSVTLNAFMYSTRAIQLSLQLVQDSFVNLEQLVPDLLAERLGRTLNQHIVNGTGTGQPFGIFPRATASALVVGGTVAAPTFTGDLFIDLMHNCDPAYRNAPGAGFMMHDTIVQRARKLKDNNGQYLWQPSLQLGQPDRLLGYPLYVNQACPTLAANARIAAFGDYSRYYWREVAQMDLFRLDELYIMNGQIAFVGLYRGDGNLIAPAAVRTLAAPAS